MSSTSYSRNKYRCLLRPNHNVIVPNDNINEPKPGLNLVYILKNISN